MSQAVYESSISACFISISAKRLEDSKTVLGVVDLGNHKTNVFLDTFMVNMITLSKREYSSMNLCIIQIDA